MVVGDKKFSMVSNVIVGGGGGGLGLFSPRKILYFSTHRTAFHACSETDFFNISNIQGLRDMLSTHFLNLRYSPHESPGNEVGYLQHNV